MLKNFSNHLTTHPLHKHLLFILLAILAAWNIGYHFGTFDQVIHIPFLKKTANPNLYPGDPFLKLRIDRPSFFWFPFIPLLRLAILPGAMFLTHLMTIYGTIWMAWEIALHLFIDPRVSLMISIALIFPHLGFPNVQAIEFSLLNRTFALPILLGSMLLYLKDKKFLAYLLCGFSFNLHVIYATYVFIMFCVDEIISRDWDHWWGFPVNTAVFIFIASPVLIWRLQSGISDHFSLRPDILQLVSNGLLYTVFYPVGPFWYTLGNFFVGLGTIWGFVLGYRVTLSEKRHKTMRNFAMGVGLMLSVGLAASYFFPVILLLQFQFLRSGVFLLYFSLLYMAFFLYHQFRSGELSKTAFVLLCCSFIAMGTPLITILLWLLMRWFRLINLKPLSATPLLIGVLVFMVFFGLQMNLWAPGFHVKGPDSDWRDAQEWALQHTSLEAKFITPPYFFGNYETNWRVFSERPTVVSVSESMEILFNPNYLDDFTSRFNDIAPGAIDQFNGNLKETLRITKKAYYTNTTEKFVELGCRYDADFLVVEQGHPYAFDLAYNNQGFLIYQLPACP